MGNVSFHHRHLQIPLSSGGDFCSCCGNSSFGKTAVTCFNTTPISTREVHQPLILGESQGYKYVYIHKKNYTKPGFGSICLKKAYKHTLKPYTKKSFQRTQRGLSVVIGTFTWGFSPKNPFYVYIWLGDLHIQAEFQGVSLLCVNKRCHLLRSNKKFFKSCTLNSNLPL